MEQRFMTKKASLLGVGILLLAGIGVLYVGCGQADEVRSPAKKNGDGNGAASRKRVAVVLPKKGGLEKLTTQPATIEAFEFADLYAKVSGYLKTQPYDIGDVVKKGELLAEIDAPEYQLTLDEAEAETAQAEAKVEQMLARVATTKADYEAAKANIALVEAELGKAKSYLKFREIQYRRIKALFDKNSIDERSVDEKEEQRDAAQAAERSAEAAIENAKAQAVAAAARIDQAQADVVDARARVRVAQATAAKAKVFVDFTKIVSPYNGVITRRSFHPDDFIRAAENGGNIPLLTVARTDKMRVILKVPERDAPFTDPGDPALVELDGVPDGRFHGTVARIANSEDRTSRSMRTEIDLPNESQQLRDGMWGKVTVTLRKAGKWMSVPSSSVMNGSTSKKHSVFVVQDGKALLKPVEVGANDGIRAEILSGISATDHVVVRPGTDLVNGAAVETEELELADERAGNHG